MSFELSRRTLLRTSGPALAALLAGCGDSSNQSGDDPTESAGTPTEPGTTTVVPERPPTTTVQLSDPATTESGTGSKTTTATPTSTRTEPGDSGADVSLWHSRESGGAQLLRGTKAAFNEQFEPQVTLTKFPTEQYLNKLRTSIPAGEGPHLFIWPHDIAGEFWESRSLSDQQDAVEIGPGQYVKSALGAATYEGYLVGLPFAAESPALIYNRDILDEMGQDVPTTLSEMEAVMDEYNDPNNGQFGLGHPVNPYFASWALQAFGGEIYDEQAGELGLTSDAVADGLKLITERLRPYMPKDPAYGAQTAVFNDGNAPLMINGPWTTPELKDEDFEWGVSRIPAPEGGKPRPYMGVKLVYFARKLEREPETAQAARQFARWYTTNDERLIAFANRTGRVPVKRELLDSSALSDPIKGFAAQVRNGYPIPQSAEMNAVWAPVQNAVLEAFNTDRDVEPLLEEAASEIRNEWES